MALLRRLQHQAKAGINERAQSTLNAYGTVETFDHGGHRPPLQLAVPILRFHVTANAKVDKVIGAHGAAIKIKLRAPAVEGKANVALHHFLADRLQIPTRNIVLERGQKLREKLIRIEGLSQIEIHRRLGF